MKWTNSQKCIIFEIENVNRPIINTETESIFTNSQQTLVQDQMTSQLNSTKHLKKSYYLSSNQSTKLRRKEHFLAHSVWSAAAAAKSLQSCPTLCDPIDSSPPGSPVPGILQARTLECGQHSLNTKSKHLIKNTHTQTTDQHLLYTDIKKC